MHCIRSPRENASSTRALSIDSLNKYFQKTINRRSFLRRSYDIVRKNVARRGHIATDRRRFKSEKTLHGGGDSSLSIVEYYRNTYGGSDDDVLVISTDSDIVKLNQKSPNLGHSNAR